jgi:isopenicillin N synthase-like dioxygenase
MFMAAYEKLMEAVAVSIGGLPQNYFTPKIINGTSIFRAIHYPPITEDPGVALRSEQHEDINFLTILVGASAGGLQVLSHDNEWIDVIPTQNEVVINVGDMLQNLTNGVYRSTTHRVVNPPRKEWNKRRLSIPFFGHVLRHMSLSPLPQFIEHGHEPEYRNITAGAYLDERLKEIGLVN